MRSARVLVTVVLVALGLAWGPHSDARAVDSCQSAPALSPDIEALPWAQRMYNPADKIWPFSTGAGVIVAVLDSGVDGTHVQLAGKVLPGASLVPGLPATGDIDCVPQGTGVAGIIAAEEIDGTGFAGLAPDATILPIRVSEKAHRSPGDDPLSPGVLAAGIDYAVASGANVIAVSAITYREDPVLQAAVTNAVSAGVVVVAGVGDGHEQAPVGTGPTASEDPAPFPAVYDGVIGVGAIGRDGNRAPFSQIGSYVDLVAPGLEVTSTALGGHESYNGTGMAAGFVAASAALMLGQPGSDLLGLVGAQRVNVLTARLLGTADGTAGEASAYGAGLVDPYRAMTETTGATSPETLAPRVPPPPDEAAQQLAAERAAASDAALRAALLAGGLGLAVLAAAFVLPRARHRRWRPGRDREVRPIREDKRPEFLPGEMLFQASVEGPKDNSKDRVG